MDTTCQVTIHTQPRSSNIFVQHDEDIMTQHDICKDTDTSNYIKPKKEEHIVVDRLLITQTKTKQTPFLKMMSLWCRQPIVFSN